jgi:hypothetical protein
LIAVFGSLTVELAALVRELGAHDGQLPKRYKTWSYPFARVEFAFFAARPLAILLTAQTELSALYFGISTPLIYDRLAAGMRPGNDNNGPDPDPANESG